MSTLKHKYIMGIVNRWGGDAKPRSRRHSSHSGQFLYFDGGLNGPSGAILL
jgi:hypothetical protein